MAGGLFFTESLGFYDHRDADLVCCDGLTIPVHGVIIQQHSAPLNKAITAKKEEFYARPHKPGEVVKLAVQGDGQTVHRIISFIYTSTYNDDDCKLSFPITTPPPESLLIDLTGDSSLANYEDGSVESLQFWFQNLEISPKDFKTPTFSKAWANAKVFRVACEWGVGRLVVESSSRFTAFVSGSSDQDGFREFVAAVYSSFPDNELCDHVAEECANNVDFVVERLGDLLKEKGLLTYKILQKVVKQTSTLSSQALRLLPPAQDKVASLQLRVAELEAVLANTSQANNGPRRLLSEEAAQTNGYSNSSTDISSLQAQVCNLRHQVAEKSEDADHKAHLLTEGDIEIARLRKELKDITRERVGRKEVVASLQKDIRDLNSGNERLSKEARLLRDEVKKKETSANEAKTVVRTRDARIQELQAEVNRLRVIAERAWENTRALARGRDQQEQSSPTERTAASSRPGSSVNRENQRLTTTTSNTLIDVSPVTSPLRQHTTAFPVSSASANGNSISNTPGGNNGGPETFVDRLRRQRQGAAGISNVSNVALPSTLASAQNTIPSSLHGARSSNTQGRSSSMQVTPRLSVPTNAPDARALAVHQAVIAQKDREISELKLNNNFLRLQLCDARTGPTSSRITRGGPVHSSGGPAHSSGGDVRLEPLLKALKEASLEHRACGECMFNFNSQFRGITEDRSSHYLIMKCTKCEAEAARWDIRG